MAGLGGLLLRSLEAREVYDGRGGISSLEAALVSPVSLPVDGRAAGTCRVVLQTGKDAGTASMRTSRSTGALASHRSVPMLSSSAYASAGHVPSLLSPRLSALGVSGGGSSSCTPLSPPATSHIGKTPSVTCDFDGSSSWQQPAHVAAALGEVAALNRVSEVEDFLDTAELDGAEEYQGVTGSMLRLVHSTASEHVPEQGSMEAAGTACSLWGRLAAETMPEHIKPRVEGMEQYHRSLTDVGPSGNSKPGGRWSAAAMAHTYISHGSLDPMQGRAAAILSPRHSRTSCKSPPSVGAHHKPSRAVSLLAGVGPAQLLQQQQAEGKPSLKDRIKRGLSSGCAGAASDATAVIEPLQARTSPPLSPRVCHQWMPVLSMTGAGARSQGQFMGRFTALGRARLRPKHCLSSAPRHGRQRTAAHVKHGLARSVQAHVCCMA